MATRGDGGVPGSQCERAKPVVPWGPLGTVHGDVGGTCHASVPVMPSACGMAWRRESQLDYLLERHSPQSRRRFGGNLVRPMDRSAQELGVAAALD